MYLSEINKYNSDKSFDIKEGKTKINLKGLFCWNERIREWNKTWPAKKDHLALML